MQGFPPLEDRRVDRTNALFGVPYNRWSYQNMRSIYPTAAIKTANESVRINRKIDGGIDNLTVRRENGEVMDITTWLRESYVDSVVVVQGDTIVWERYLNGMNADAAHQMMSVTKSFAGLFGLIAASDGLLNEGQFNGQPVIDPAIIQKLSKGASLDAFNNGPLARGNFGDWREWAVDLSGR